MCIAAACAHMPCAWLRAGERVPYLVRCTMSDSEDVSLSGSGADKRPHASSYYAWSADKARRGAELTAFGVSHVPQPIHAAPGAPAPVPSNAAGAGSAWNAAGTW